MYLGGLLALARQIPRYHELLASLPTSSGILRLSSLEGAKAWLVAALYRDSRRPFLVVTPHAKRAAQIAEQLVLYLGPDAPVRHLPDPDALFYEAIPADPRTAQARVGALLSLNEFDPEHMPLIVTSARAILQRLVEPKAIRQAVTVLRPGDPASPATLLSSWVALGYRHELLVEEPGTFARRGGIIDVFPPNAERPVRLDFFGDELETIRAFDPLTQRSDQHLDSIVIGPAAEVWPAANPAAVDALNKLDLSRLREDVRDRWARELASLSAGGVIPEATATYFTAATLIDYFPGDTLLVMDESGQIRVTAAEVVEQSEQLRGELIGRGELTANFPVPYISWDELLISALRRFGCIDLSWQSPPDLASAAQHPDGPAGRPSGNAPSDSLQSGLAASWQVISPYAGRLKTVLDECEVARRSGATVVVISQQASRLSELWRERDVDVLPVADLSTAPPPSSLTVVHGTLPDGFGVRFSEEAGSVLRIVTDQEMFGWSKPARVVRRRSAAREAFVAELKPGDFVVHIEHGVARFEQLTKIQSDGVEREYLVLSYAEGDKLYVPSDKADRVNRYIGVGDHEPALSRLGGSEWVRAKARVKAAAKEVATELLDIQAKREVKVGFAFNPDAVWQQEMEGSFPYIETADQLQAAAEVKADMERPKPMDRLLCGDVGYGKTEVALRAAFKAVMDGKQVAILVPTTVLAQQHFNTFQERMQAFPVRIEMLSRFRSEKEQRAVLAALAVGQVDICIGTHRLLQKDVAFSDLGLVIIDEEQRFGVLHKERFKRLRHEVDVLTLTATPIPRTLHMALAGLRDISTMETPPEERLPIKTYVCEYDERLIREAILRELERGGQVYFVHNRVQTIYRTAKRIEELVPEANVVVGHGQLPEEQLEKVMLDFSAGRADVLVCSTIIESGLDIPNVNTIIVDQSDRLGLAQMYQLRGRVGRGANRAYAYFTYSKDQRLLPAAEKRLRAIFEATELGAGFRIAMKDLEIRGAGNLLGSEQHGHLAAVGFDLYCRLLAEAVQELRGGVEIAAPEVRIDLPLSAFLPPDYIGDEMLRLNLYQRLASVNSEAHLANLVLEMQDRFGRPPRPVVNLAYLVQIKLLARQAGVVDLTVDGPVLVLRLANPENLDRPLLQRTFGPRLKVGHTMLRLDRTRGDTWLDELQSLLETLAGETQAASYARGAARTSLR